MPAICNSYDLASLCDTGHSVALGALKRLSCLGLAKPIEADTWSLGLPINSRPARRQSYALRRTIEPAGLIAQTFRLDREWLHRSRSRHLAFAARPWRDTLAIELFEMNADFHEQLGRCSGNPFIVETIRQQNKLRSFLNFEWVGGAARAHASIGEHLAIIDALDVGDNRLAWELMTDHLQSAESIAPTVS
ncbi:MAG: yjjM [Bradyrhizobium sp.]|nr:yjjM [Bradyrhizobium sp.]